MALDYLMHGDLHEDRTDATSLCTQQFADARNMTDKCVSFHHAHAPPHYRTTAHAPPPVLEKLTANDTRLSPLDRLAALTLLAHMPQTQREAAKALDKSLQEWSKDLLLMNKWFRIQATGNVPPNDPNCLWRSMG